MAKRIDYIDTTKAIGILLMILGHCQYIGNIPGLSRLVYSFHMPLFFIISGMFIKPLCLYESLGKYSKAYLQPYVVTCLLMLVLTIVLSLVSGWNFAEHVITALKSYIFASGSNLGTAYLHDFPKVGMIWFLFALFWGCLFYSLIKKYTKNTFQQLFLTFFLFTIGYITGKYIRLPFSIQSGMCAVIYIMTGDVIKKNEVVERITNDSWFFSTLLIFMWITSALLLGGINMACNSYTEGLIQVPVSIIATLVVSMLCFKCRFKIGWLGKNTLAILVGHQLFKSYCWQTSFDFDRVMPILPPPVALILEFSIQVCIAVIIGLLVKKVKLI